MYTRTPLRYAGGKTRAIKIITPLVENHQQIVSPFIGGGSLEVHWSCLGHKVIGYDVFFALTNFWQVLLNQRDQLIDRLKDIEFGQESYDEIKEQLLAWDKTQAMLNNHKTDYYKRKPQELDPVTAAAFYFYNHNLSFGPMYLGWLSKIYNVDKWERMIDNLSQFECPNLQVFESDFVKVLQRHQNDFLYLDPPYYLEPTGDNKMFAGMYPNRNLPVHHEQFDHETLRDLLREHKGGFVLSYNDCDIIRNYYDGFNFQFPSWSYSLGSGETRIGKNRKNKNLSNKKESHEILILSEQINTVENFFTI